MKKLVLLLLTTVQFSCSSDLLLPCDGDGPSGNLCREYKYYHGSPLGYVSYEYQADTLEIARFYDRSSQLEKTVIVRFENGKPTVLTEQFADQNSRVQSWHYNQMDSLSAIVYGANDSLIEISYENSVRLQRSVFRQGELSGYSVYRYFEDDGKLYRIYQYDSNDSLLSYQSFEYFSTGQKRISYFTSEHRLIGRRVFNSLNGLTTSIEFKDSTGTVRERSDYIYDAAFSLIEKTESKASQTYKSVFLYY